MDLVQLVAMNWLLCICIYVVATQDEPVLIQLNVVHSTLDYVLTLVVINTRLRSERIDTFNSL